MLSGPRWPGVALPVRIGDAPLVPRPGRAGQAGRLDQGLVTTLVPHVDHRGPAATGTTQGRQLDTLVGHPAAGAGRLAEQPGARFRRVAAADGRAGGRPAGALPGPADPAIRAAADWRSSEWLAARGTNSPPWPAMSRQITVTPVAIRPRTTTAVARRRGNGSCSGPAPSYGGVVRENIRQITAPGSRSQLRSPSRWGRERGSQSRKPAAGRRASSRRPGGQPNGCRLAGRPPGGSWPMLGWRA